MGTDPFFRGDPVTDVLSLYPRKKGPVPASRTCGISYGFAGKGEKGSDPFSVLYSLSISLTKGFVCCRESAASSFRTFRYMLCNAATIEGPSSSTLTITDPGSLLVLGAFNLYYETFIGDLSQIDTSGGGSFIQLPAGYVPEPATVWLLVVGGCWVMGGRRRRR